MNEVTRILDAIGQGDPQAAEELLPLVYDELRKLAAQRLTKEKPGQTLQATALVHEAYLRLVGADDPPRWDSRGHFFAGAAEAMRRILIDQARHKLSQRQGGYRKRQALDDGEIAVPEPSGRMPQGLDESADESEGGSVRKPCCRFSCTNVICAGMIDLVYATA